MSTPNADAPDEPPVVRVDGVGGGRPLGPAEMAHLFHGSAPGSEALPTLSTPPPTPAPAVASPTPRQARATFFAIGAAACVVAALHFLGLRSPPPPPAATPKREFAGAVEALPGGRVRFTYEFADPRELADWEPAPDDRGRTPLPSVHDGALWLAGGRPGVLRFRTELRAERVRVVAACTAKDWTEHITTYLNTRWECRWEGAWGLACLMRGDGLSCYADGRRVEFGAPPRCKLGQTYDQEVRLDGDGHMSWSLDRSEVYTVYLPRLAGRAGWVLVGCFEGSVRIDRVEIEGPAPPVGR
ncbi:MAG: hypothetical protein HYZ53_10440 [Planctomycetes bacterium]|nr:hypothetical protein [Planctomycetota bacterium]